MLRWLAIKKNIKKKKKPTEKVNPDRIGSQEFNIDRLEMGKYKIEMEKYKLEGWPNFHPGEVTKWIK